MLLRGFKARAERRPWMDAVAIYIYEKRGDGTISYLKDLVFETIKPADAILDDTKLELPFDVAQQLVDALWDCGLRPSEGSGSAGALRATENHLKDMQGLTNRLLSLVERHG